ncbi:MAG: lipid-binding SYLF domain-containing protein [Chthoniobacterales bacterium]|nr:lipid-binding SYLF domain-containing protein [Chthoniobacterales bacterium]
MKSQLKVLVCLVAAATAGIGMVGCRATPETAGEKRALKSEGEAALERMYSWGPDLEAFVDGAHGYAIFPSVGKAGLLVGAAYGRGEVYRGGEMIGYADITQGTVGAQVGAQEFSELIVFETETAMQRFIDDAFDVTANASAIILKEGAGAAWNYDNGVVIIVQPKSGAMAEATVGGQKFDYTPKDEATTRRAEGDRTRADTDVDADNDNRDANRKDKDGVDVDVDVDKK